MRRIHPGEILDIEFIQELDISILALSKDTGIPINTLIHIIDGYENITEDIANKLAFYFKNSPEFWLNLQKDYDNKTLKT